MKNLKYLPAALAATVVAANPVSAQINNPPNITNPTKSPNFGDILSTVINGALFFAAAIAVLFLIVGGFRYVVSTGNETQVEAAKKTILYAVLGLIIIFIAFVLAKAIQNLLGVQSRFII